MNFKELINALSQINEQLREQSIHALNVSLVAKYLVALPDKKELEKFIKKELKDNWQQLDKLE